VEVLVLYAFGCCDTYATYLTGVGANLSNLGQELNTGHPFLGGQSGLASKVVKVCNETLKDVLHTLVGTLGVNNDSVGSDIIGSEVLHRRNDDFGGIHCSEYLVEAVKWGGNLDGFLEVFGMEMELSESFGFHFEADKKVFYGWPAGYQELKEFLVRI
jgi:hypothetical protein